MNETTTPDLRTLLDEIDRTDKGGSENAWVCALTDLAAAVRTQLAPLPEGETERMAAQADRAARTMAPPVPGVTRNAGYIVRAVIHMHPHEDGLLEQWIVAAKDAAGTPNWVTWNAYQRDDSQAGTLAYDGGHYFFSPNPVVNRRAALADLAERAGLVPDMAQRIASLIGNGPLSTAEEKRVARGLRRFSGR